MVGLKVEVFVHFSKYHSRCIFHKLASRQCLRGAVVIIRLKYDWDVEDGELWLLLNIVCVLSHVTEKRKSS